ncbi:MAG: hypothetical protein K8T91_17980 [Planctomycetes bacterium]|nr:hypothetical protein [Planctomycetota bacterium]
MRCSVASWPCFLLLLNALAALGPIASATAQTSVLVGTPAEHRAEARIRDALLTPITAEWFENSLDRALTDLRRRLGIDVKLDLHALEAINITGDSMVKINVRGVTARAALDLLVHSLDPTLAWTIQDEVLWITTKEAAQHRMQTRVYPVGDLVVLYEGDYPDFEPLIELIQKVIEPSTWDAEGGPGAIQQFTANTSLVCTQTRDVHERIEGLLEVMRQVHEPGKIVLKAYVEALKSEESSDDARSLGYGFSYGSAPMIDANPEPWRVPQRYDE